MKVFCACSFVLTILLAIGLKKGAVINSNAELRNQQQHSPQRSAQDLIRIIRCPDGSYIILVEPDDKCPPPPRSDPDPHFRTYQGTYYDYHGGCDLVLVQSSLIDIHIRTQVRNNASGRTWSGVDKFALRVNDDIFEVHADPFKVFYNGVDTESNAELLTQLALRYRFFPDRPRFYLPEGDQFIDVGIFGDTDPTLCIAFSAHMSTILDAVGMYGARADTGNGMLGRDGTTRYDPVASANAFGEEWQVDPNVDPNLFMDPGVPTCVYARRTLQDEQTEADLQALAKEACQFLENVDEDKYRNCIFDVSVTGDAKWAGIPVYTGEEPKFEFADQCVSDGNECQQEGGKCVWRCNSNENTCITSMCTGKSGFNEFSEEALQGGFVDGCSCELPLDYVPPPTGSEGCGLFGIGELLGLCFILNFFQSLLESFFSLF